MPSPSLDLFGDPLRLPTRRERQRVATMRKPGPDAMPAAALREPTAAALLERLLLAPAAAGAPEKTLLTPRAALNPAPRLPPTRLAPEQLQIHPELWGGAELGRVSGPCRSSGFALLDAELPGGGWPTRALTELLLEGGVEWRLLAPALAPLLQNSAGGTGGKRSRRLLLIGPPHAPHPPGLAAWGIPAAACLWVDVQSPYERQWVLEQALKADADELAGVLAWMPGMAPRALRRAQTLAARCRAPVFVLQHDPSPNTRARASAAPLRLQVSVGPQWDQLCVRILKRRGPPPLAPLWLQAPPPSLAAVLPVQAEPSAVLKHLPATLQTLLQQSA